MADEVYNSDGITDAASPEVAAQVAGYREKLNTMLKGGTPTPTSTPARYVPTAGQRQAPAAMAKNDGGYIPDGNTPAKGSSARAAQAGEDRRLALTKELVSGTLTPAERDGKSRELRGLIASMATPEEQQAMEGATLQDHRAAYDLAPPDLPPSVLAIYESDFSAWESDFLLAARQHGLPSDLVRDLRDAGVRLGMQVDGKPLSDELVDGALKKYAGRLTATQIKALKAYWRRIEGGGAA